MEKVLGIGGLFFRSEDPDALAAWYRDALGIDLVPSDYDTEPWSQQAGPTVFAPFRSDTSYYPSQQQTMVNFRVRDVDAMAEQLRAKGAEVTVDPETYPNGRFARTHDPDGNAIELWEPKTPA